MEKNENGFSDYLVRGARSGTNGSSTNGSSTNGSGTNGSSTNGSGTNGSSTNRNGNNATQDMNSSRGGCAGTGPIWQGDVLNAERNTARVGESCPMRTAQHLAMVYSPYQHWRMLYNTADALDNGTLFEELFKPLEDCYGR